jgi:accessory gene regulator B
VDQLAARVGDSLARQLSLTGERQDVVTFGALALLHNGTTLAVTLGAGALLGLLPEVAVALGTAAALRHVSGGFHLSTPLRCLVASATFFCLAAVGGRWTLLWLGSPLGVPLVLTLLLAGLVPVFRYAPAAATHRPLSEAHRLRLRRQALWLVTVTAALFGAGAMAHAWWSMPGLIALAVQGLSLALKP